MIDRMGSAVFLFKLCEERLNGEGSKGDGCTPPEAVSTHDRSRPRGHGASSVKNTSQRGRVIELTDQFPSHGRQPWATAGGRAAGPLVSFHLKHFAESLDQGRDSVQCLWMD